MCVCVSVSVFMCTYCTYMYIIIHVHSYGSFLTHFCYYELANLTYYYCTYYVIIIIISVNTFKTATCKFEFKTFCF